MHEIPEQFYLNRQTKDLPVYLGKVTCMRYHNTLTEQVDKIQCLAVYLNKLTHLRYHSIFKRMGRSCKIVYQGNLTYLTEIGMCTRSACLSLCIIYLGELICKRCNSTFKRTGG